MNNSKIICIGEVLWDSLPNGLFLGGAPLNVALNLKSLGLDARILSAIGRDHFGDLAIQKIKDSSLSTDLIQVRNDKKTGIVEVKLDEKGVPAYKIHEQVAWDYIEVSDDAVKAVKDADMLVIGSLIFRNQKSAESVRKLINSTSAKIVTDVNFRAPFYSEALVDEILELTDILKVNDEELDEIMNWKKENLYYRDAIEYLHSCYGIDTILVTRGDQGSTYYTNGVFYEKDRYKVTVKDTVGAGDGFLAGAIYSILNNFSPLETISFANATGAFVAGKNGATPGLNKSKIEALIK